MTRVLRRVFGDVSLWGRVEVGTHFVHCVTPRSREGFGVGSECCLYDHVIGSYKRGLL